MIIISFLPLEEKVSHMQILFLLGALMLINIQLL